ncbi:GlxA family transcriptional regulator [Kutzneria buriramensis]|uniref:Transcriptional regulator GlxA family with amidase domain n=1 Tax=Kutzneria buriramensis TaxID=1045776 RepID=A0A3E0H513_9PSEU|nr:helix-turn-helix domain-containing protein [Kutzneria buriramensis]REH38156.1 transcriptional regulator GlxA family with amidase domain [Kutzneria buriramensis]
MARRVALLVLPRVIALDYSIAINILGEQRGYELFTGGEAGHAGPEDGVVIVPSHPLSAVEEADVVVVPGFGDPHIPPPEPFLDAIARSAERGATVVGVCTGTFALAASGITADRQVTTHWRYTAHLQELFPRTKVVENVLHIQDGNLLTSAGAGAAIDLCLHLIRTDFGVDAELAAGRDIVAGPARPGPQPQYLDVLTPPDADLSDTRGWALQRIAEPLTVDQLARHSAMSRRTFIRRFREETGLPPMRWLTLQRILVARRLLETSDWSVDRIADAAGMGTAANFRVIFRRETGSLPSDYRRAHRR